MSTPPSIKPLSRPKASTIVAEGIALGIATPETIVALKGHSKRCAGHTQASSLFGPPLQGELFTLTLILALTVGGSLRAAEPPAAPPAAAPRPVFKAGFAERDITPDLGMEEPGGYGKVYHRAFHDPCKVRAAVFDDGRQRVALVGIDLLLITRALTKEARTEIEKRCGIPAGNILLGASHSHSSGPIGMAEPGEFDEASPLVLQ